jgi:aminopeptidase N
MKNFFTIIAVIATTLVNAQFAFPTRDESWKKKYRSFVTKNNDLIHTKLEAKFNYDKSQLNGKVWITLKPHFYATKMLELDAKGMDINAVELVKVGAKNLPLSFDYRDSLNLKINLDKEYKASEKYTIYISYTAKPNDFMSEGSAAIKDAKGLYFINPKGEDKDKPTQIWTQGETEATSVWVPTIDKPNQKTTQEFYLTVPAKYVTLSNGKLVSQTPNADKTRTDYWKMELPHAPYLFFIGIGDYAVIKDSYKGKEVNYYVEKEYAKAAQKIFGNTPEMMKFYSEKVTGIEYPWNKYSQITGRDYVSGAMENTTATLHQESAQQNLRELQDGNLWEGTIAHELFHQWFGDYVTAESWSNLTVNESFADYSQYLWEEYKYGADAAGEENDNEMKAYLSGGNNSKKDLVRFYYSNKEDMFDLVSYQKGGRILNMLRNYVGDSAFFKSLNKYLTDNKFGNGSAHKLRLAFESITGKDLNWYFNQWYFNSGHPKLTISNSYNAETKMVSLFVKQTQDTTKIFKLPVAIDVYVGKQKTRHDVWIENRFDTIKLPANAAPDLVKFDADNILLAEKKEKKTFQQLLIQYKQAGKYLDRKEALDYAAKNKTEVGAMQLLVTALNDPYPKFRIKAITALEDTTVDAATLKIIETIANTDKKKTVRAEAIDFLGQLKDKKYTSLFNNGIKDSSYSVAGASLEALMEIDDAAVLKLIPELKKDMKGRLKSAVEKAAILTKTDADFDTMYSHFENFGLMEKFNDLGNYFFYLSRVNNTENFKKGIDQLTKFRDMVAPYGQGIKEGINKAILSMKKTKETAKATSKTPTDFDEQIKYIIEQTAD